MIVRFDELPSVRSRHSHETIVLAGGCFDIVHEGHVLGMQYCKSQGDILVVGVSSDDRIRQRKGEGRPIRSQLGRIAVVDAFESVDYSFLMPMPAQQTPTIQAIQALRPDIFIDHIENHDRWISSQDQLQQLGTQLRFNITQRQDSSTNIIARIIEQATAQ